MRRAPRDEPFEALAQPDLRGEAKVLGSPPRVADAVADQGRGAARLIADRLVGAGQLEQDLGKLLERGADAGSDIVETVGG